MMFTTKKVLKVKIVFNMLYKLIKNPEASKKRQKRKAVEKLNLSRAAKKF